MAAPNTGGQLRTKIADMQVGDYIHVRHHYNSSNKIHLFEYWGNPAIANLSEIPVNGRDKTASQYVAKAYFIKADKGLLICDRIVTNTISWDELNSSDYIEGKTLEIKIDSINFANGGGYSNFNQAGIIRSLGGGNSYATADGKSSTTDTGNGAWPIDNEWDTYIVKKDYGTGAGRDDIWHWKQGVRTLTQDTHVSASANRTFRGTSNTTTGLITETGAVGSSSAQALNGFRPVFEYQEVTP